MPDTNDPEKPVASGHLEFTTGAAVRPGFIPLPADSNLLKRWFYRCLFASHRDSRKRDRQSISWLIAYFFNGGTPVPYTVRDVSRSGIYVYTEERWSVGTILRLTLADAHLPTPERSLTVNATVTRFGKDGMGLKFVLYKPNERKPDWSLGYESVEVSAKEVQQFLDFIKNG